MVGSTQMADAILISTFCYGDQGMRMGVFVFTEQVLRLNLCTPWPPITIRAAVLL
jgi:hypothetical protein